MEAHLFIDRKAGIGAEADFRAEQRTVIQPDPARNRERPLRERQLRIAAAPLHLGIAAVIGGVSCPLVIATAVKRERIGQPDRGAQIGAVEIAVTNERAEGAGAEPVCVGHGIGRGQVERVAIVSECRAGGILLGILRVLGIAEIVDLDGAIRIAAHCTQRQIIAECEPGIAPERGLFETVLLGSGCQRRKALILEPAAIGGDAEAVLGIAGAPGQVEAVAAAIFGRCLGARLVLRGGDKDHPAHRRATPDRAVRSTQHLDPLHIAGQQVGQIVAIADGRWVGDANPVDHGQHLVIVGSTDANSRSRADAAIAVERDAGHTFEHARDVRPLHALNLLAVDDRDRLAGLGDGRFGTRSGNDDRGVIVRFRPCRRRDRCKNSTEKQDFTHNSSNHLRTCRSWQEALCAIGRDCPKRKYPRFRWLVVHPAHWPNDYRGTGLLARRIARPPPPSRFPSGVMEAALPGHSCGGSAGFSPASLFRSGLPDIP